MSLQLAILKGKIFEAKNYLRATDYIITKLSSVEIIKQTNING